MTISNTPSHKESVIVLASHTDSKPQSAVSQKPHIYDFTTKDLPVTGSADEFRIDDYIDSLEPDQIAEIDAQNSWVSDEFYPETNLASLRLNAGLSQKSLANQCGLEQSHISRYESGKHTPGLFQATELAKVLGVSLDTFAAACRASGMTK